MADEELQRGLADMQGRLFCVVRVLLGPQADAEDVLQSANLAILRHAEEYDGKRPLWPWVRAFAVRTAIKYAQTASKRRVLFDSALLEKLAAKLEETDDAPDFRLGTLEKCIAKLDASSRKLIEERYFRKKRVDDICRERGLSRDSVSSSLGRIRRKLRQCMGERAFNEEEELAASSILDGETAKEVPIDAWMGMAVLHAEIEVFAAERRLRRASSGKWKVAAIAAGACAVFGAVAGTSIAKTKTQKKTIVEIEQTGENTEMKLIGKRTLAVTAVASAAIADTSAFKPAAEGSSAAGTVEARQFAQTTAENAGMVEGRLCASGTSQEAKPIDTATPQGTVIILF